MHTEIATYNDTDRIIKGQMLKAIDGRNSVDGEHFPVDKEVIVVGTKIAAQYWKGQKPIETLVQRPNEPPIDIDKLNAAIPKKEWEMGLNNEKRPPWQLNYIVYLLDPNDGSTYTMINSTAGMRIAFEHLCDRLRNMQILRGATIVQIVTIGSKPMKTQFGIKMRPEFVVKEWREIGAGAQQVSAANPKMIGKPVAPLTTKEIVGDDIPEESSAA